MFSKIYKSFFAKYSESLNIIHLDQGGFYQADKLAIPANVILLFQPAHSPKLNPAERLWEYIKKWLRWSNFKNLTQLHSKVDEIVEKMTQEVIAYLTSCDYILNALNLAHT